MVKPKETQHQAENTPPGTASAANQDTPDQDNVRQCLLLRQKRPRQQLVRFVIGPDNQLVPDILEVLPGRGLWLSAEKDIVARAVDRNVFSRAARQAVKVPQDLGAQVERLLVRRCGDLIGLARRAGQLIAGFDGVQTAIRSGRVDLLLTAIDSAGRDGRELAVRAHGCHKLRILTAAEQGAPLGSDHAVHLSLVAGRLSDLLWRDGTRLAGFRAAATAEAHRISDANDADER